MKLRIASSLAVAILSAVTALPGRADERHDEGRRGVRPEARHDVRREAPVERRVVRGWRGERDIRHFDNRHLPVWRAGTWRHGRHDGRVGWWWVVAGMWYFYPAPIYPYPDPYIPPYAVVQTAPPATVPAVPAPPQNWYYCEASKSYYPYVSSCPAGWKAVPATPPSPPAR